MCHRMPDSSQLRQLYLLASLCNMVFSQVSCLDEKGVGNDGRVYPLSASSCVLSVGENEEKL